MSFFGNKPKLQIVKFESSAIGDKNSINSMHHKSSYLFWINPSVVIPVVNSASFIATSFLCMGYLPNPLKAKHICCYLFTIMKSSLALYTFLVWSYIIFISKDHWINSIGTFFGRSGFHRFRIHFTRGWNPNFFSYAYTKYYKYYVMNYSINSFTGASEAPVIVVVVY